MTYVDPESGVRTSLSWLVAHTRAYDQSDLTARIKEMCSRPLPHGEVP
jgi:hypothetical protein